jgi:hypothetical protein
MKNPTSLIPLVLLSALFTACGQEEVEETGQDTQQEDAFAPEEGRWSFQGWEVESDGCSLEEEWAAPNGFDLRLEEGGFNLDMTTLDETTCTLETGVFLCESVGREWPFESGTSLVESLVLTGEFQASNRASGEATIGQECLGEGCEQLGELRGATYPCQTVMAFEAETD